MTVRAATHLIGLCPICFHTSPRQRGHVVVGGRMVDHGYEVPWGTGGRKGSCSGVGAPHFGTPEGREVTRRYVKGLRSQLKRLRATIAAILGGTADVFRRTYKGGGMYEEIKIEKPTDYDRTCYASEFEMHARMIGHAVDDLDARIAAWKPTDPIRAARPDNAPNVHARAAGGRGRACAVSYRGHTGIVTDDPAKVTCQRCKKHAAARAARAAWDARPEVVAAKAAYDAAVANETAVLANVRAETPEAYAARRDAITAKYKAEDALRRARRMPKGGAA